MATATESDLEVLGRLGKALSNPSRRSVLLRLAGAPAYPADLAAELGLSAQALSNHLSCLRGCGLVVAAAEGRRLRYEIARPQLASTLAELVLPVADPSCGPEDRR